MHDSRWLRTQAENLIREVFDAARTKGPQVVDDHDGDFEIVFRPKKKTLEQLFSKLGPVIDDP